ncbi:MAG: asparagine synthase-related protein [Melioribacteraceae bacterium]|nr:asparagine synthase-related protein [Melioribacteraceae bacterium]
MSWLFGEIVKGNNSPTDLSKIIDEEVEYSFSKVNTNIAAGGNSRNLFCSKNQNRSCFVSGIGISSADGFSKIMNDDDWASTLKLRDNVILNIDGHFVIIIVEEKTLKIYTDKLGLRDIYIQELDDRIIFSTSIKFLSYFGKLEIDYSEFSSRWLLFNQISQNSIFKNVKRIVSGKIVTINLEDDFAVNISEQKKYEFDETPIESGEFESKLASLVNLRVSQNQKLALSLSGGMDSRVMLSILLNNRKENFETHSFGDAKHPDSEIAKQIVNDFNIEHYQFNCSNHNFDDLIKEIKNYTTETLVNNAASAIMQLENYKYLSKRNLIVIDGGFGEIWRREFFYKLLFKGKSDLLKQNVDGVIPYLSLSRADIFSQDVKVEMSEGIHSQLLDVFNLLPKANKNNAENWIDLFALTTRLPNYYSHEQTRLDGMVTAVMPFAQQSLISNLFGVSREKKKNGRLFRKIINQNYPKLASYPLVKGVIRHPYILNSLQSRIWAMVSKRIGNSYKGKSNTDILLDLSKTYIFDIINSKDVKESGIYDNAKIQKMVGDYYTNGSMNSGYSVDWLLSFLLFKESISKY